MPCRKLTALIFIFANEVFGTIEVVKTVSDLFLPVAGEVLEQNEALEENLNINLIL